MTAFDIGRLTRLELGYVGETETREIQIDVSEWLERWPGGGIAIDVLRPGRKAYYLADTEVEDGTLTWTVTYTDVAAAGRGLAQISIYDFATGKVYKSRTVETIIREAIDMEEDVDAPHPMDTWVARAVAAKEGAIAASREAEASAEAAQTAEAGAAASRDTATEAAEAAQAAAADAAKSRDTATDAAGDAQADATAAAASSTTATAAAGTAKASAEQAVEARAAAEDAAARAEEDAGAAEQSNGKAQTAAKTATNAAATAEAYRDSAKTAAGTAQTAANIWA